ncbi:hypothetical protein [Neoroseomonas rubea]|uniref:hypothetical protein n=1 Tax=Neoroseomonas rubea TaxID=2748666 RepID=UPI0018E05FBC|nr:hypothetical protein [Roseomonas rubea]
MQRRHLTIGVFAAFAPLVVGACRTRAELHADAFTPSGSVVEQRARQTRRFDTRDETMLLQAVVGVMQDLGFTIEETRPQSGLVMGSKDRDAVEAGQVASQIVLVLLAAAARTQHRVVMDRNQRIRILVVVRPTPERTASIARVTFQRIVINTDNQVSRMETMDDPQLYQAFFDQLAQSAFLTAHEI